MALRRDPTLDDDVARHWRTCQSKFSDAAAELPALAGACRAGSVGEWLARAFG